MRAERAFSACAVVVYATALFQGLTVVAFPASGTVLRSMHSLTDEAYGSLFVPQTVFTIVGSLLGGVLARRVGLRTLLVLSGLAGALSQAALLSVLVVPSARVLPVLLLGTGLMGLGFGFAAAPLNSYPRLLFPRRGDSALVFVHTAIGAGFALGPAIVSSLVAADRWAVFPGLVGVGSLIIAITGSRAGLPVQKEPPQSGGRGPLPWRALAAFGVIAVLYAFAEGTFSNWASIYLHDARGVAESLAALAISAFWAALTVGRLVVSALVARVAPNRIWLTLPLVMTVVFFLLPYARDAGTGILLFALAGFACSAFFPLTVAIASKHAPGQEALAASLLIAALMVGVGGGSFALGALRNAAGFETIYRLSVAYPVAAFSLGAMTLGLLRRPRPREEAATA
jgi:fucose permease